MSFRPVSTFEIVRLIGLQPAGETGYCMVIDPNGALAQDVNDELEAQGLALSVLDVATGTTTDLVNQLRSQTVEVAFLHGFAKWSNEKFAALDVSRSMLDTGWFLLFGVDLPTAGRFLSNAPNIRSFLGANIFAAASDPSIMSEAEIAARLAQLQEFYKLTDAEVIERAENRQLPSDPHFAEWLLLLGRSELVR